MTRVREFVRELLTAAIEVRAAATFAVATLVTVVVCVPLAIQAVDAREDVPAVVSDTDAGIVLNGLGRLDGARLRGPADISFDIEGISAVAFRLVSETGEEVLAGEDRFGPDFDLITDRNGAAGPLDTTTLADGDYSLLATMTVAGDTGDEADVVQRRASFTVDNGA